MNAVVDHSVVLEDVRGVSAYDCHKCMLQPYIPLSQSSISIIDKSHFSV